MPFDDISIQTARNPRRVPDKDRITDFETQSPDQTAIVKSI